MTKIIIDNLTENAPENKTSGEFLYECILKFIYKARYI